MLFSQTKQPTLSRSSVFLTAAFLFLLISTKNQFQAFAFIHPTPLPQYGEYTTTSLKMSSIRHTTIRDWFTGGKNTFERRQRIREELEELEDQDFLLADVQPKMLVHERDFHRESVFVQAWDEYVLVSILCTSISYSALSGFSIAEDHEGIFLYETVLKTGVSVVAGIAVLSGLYSTMVYALSILYTRTALGLERDTQYDTFLEDSEEIRNNGFRAFSISLFSFAVMVILVLAESIPLIMHLPIGGAMIGALYIGYRDWKRLVDCAIDIYDPLDEDDE